MCVRAAWCSCISSYCSESPSYLVVILMVTIKNNNKTSFVSFPRVCLCRRRRLKTDLPTPAPVSRSWPGRDKPPAHAAPSQATSSQLPQGRWKQGRNIMRQTTLQTPLNLHAVDVPFWGALFPFISKGRSCFPAFCVLIFFVFFPFLIRSMR